MHDVLDALFLRTWWSYERDSHLVFSAVYPWLNVVEGCAWLIIAILVIRRYLRHRHSHIELWYALAFLTFAGSDFREAWVLQSWLIWFKAINLVALLYLRQLVLKRYYPTKRVF